MIAIPLSAVRNWKNRGRYVALVDDCDADLAEHAWYAKVSRLGQTPLVYAVRTVTILDGQPYGLRMHRLVWERANGPISDGYEIDHIRHGEHGGLDNRRGNLRIATHTRNAANSRVRSNNTSGFKGVHFVHRIGRWQCLIRVDGVRKHLGYFDTPRQAAEAYASAAMSAFGAFALVCQESA